jgi:hypothetical protein
MDDAQPDSAAMLTLTIWPRRDTTFGGYLRAGAPVGRSGGASAWQDGAMFRLYTVSDDGDTVAWSSRQSGKTLGGTYEVVGGAAKGLGGTWRANLVSGPPATEATLNQSMQRTIIPPVEAVWPAVLFTVIVVAGVRWVRGAPVPPSEQERDPLGVLDTRVGGWLLLFVFGQLVGLVLVLLELRNFSSGLNDDVWSMGAAVSGLRGTIVVEKLMALTRLVASVIGLKLIATRSRIAPRFWFAFLVLLAVYFVGDLVSAAWIDEQSTALSGTSGRATDGSASRTSYHGYRSVIVLLVWSMYWCQSMRVRARFGQAALDKAASLPPASGAALAS